MINDHSNGFISEWMQYKKNKKQYLIDVRKILDSAVFGHKDAKIQLERLLHNG